MSPQVIFVPGLGLGPESSAPVREHLTLSHQVITLPGYGEPANSSDDLTTEALATRLANQLSQPALLVGHSASCQIVVQAALDRPELVQGLVLIGPSGDLRAADWPTLAARWLRSAVWDPARLIPVLAPQYVRTGFISMARAMEVARRYDLAEAMGKLEIPAVVVRSRHDSICPAHWVEELAERCSGEAHTLDTGSHLPVLTNGPEIAEVIQALWLTR